MNDLNVMHVSCDRFGCENVGSVLCAESGTFWDAGNYGVTVPSLKEWDPERLVGAGVGGEVGVEVVHPLVVSALGGNGPE